MTEKTKAKMPVGWKGDDMPQIFGISSITHRKGLRALAIESGESFEDVDIPSTASLDQFQLAYQSLDNYDSAFDLFDKCRGEIYWLKGQILNVIKPIEPGKKGLAKRGEWLPFLKTIEVEPDTSEHLRHINRQFTRIQSRNLGYSKMIAMYKADKKLEKQGDDPATPKKPKPKPKKPKHTPKTTVTAGHYKATLDRVRLLTVDPSTDDRDTLEDCKRAILETVVQITKAGEAIDASIAGLEEAEQLEAA